MPKHAVVIGGGISGLTIAHYLSRKQGFEVTLFESGDRFGGVIRTLRGGPFHMEAGADAFDGREPAILRLCGELGLRDELLECEPTLRRAFISRNKELLPLDLSDPFELFKSPVLGFWTRARLLFEPLIPARKSEEDESIGAFARRRFGASFEAGMIETLSRGILMAEAAGLSLREYFPEWQRMEKKYGSVGKALLEKKERSAGEAPFFTVRGGMDRLTGALARSLSGADVRTRAEAVSLRREEGRWEILLREGQRVPADAVCLAVPAPQAGRILSDAVPSLAGKLRQIRYDRIVAANMIFRREALPENKFRAGFILPSRGEKWPIASLKLIGKSEDGKYARCRAFLSGVFQRGAFAWEDGKIKKEVLDCLAGELGIREVPLWFSIERYPEGLARYEVGHGKTVSDIEDELTELPGLFLTGNGYRGFGIADCVREAKRAALAMKSYLETSAQIG